MRIQHICAILLMALSLIGCQKEEIQPLEAATEANQTLNTNAKEVAHGTRDFDINITDAEMEFKRSLQWTSFLTARTFKDHAEVREEFNAQITLQSVYDMNSLLDPNGTYPLFNQHFRDIVLLYAQGRPDQEHEPDRPLTGTGPSGMSAVAIAHAFIEYIRDEHCLELYIPNGLSSTNTAYSTTGHPLNNDPSNYGFLRLAEPLIGDEGNIRVLGIDVFDDAYVQNNDNIIIARPDREISGGMSAVGDEASCSYSQYNIDFDHFLDQ